MDDVIEQFEVLQSMVTRETRAIVIRLNRSGSPRKWFNDTEHCLTLMRIIDVSPEIPFKPVIQYARDLAVIYFRWAFSVYVAENNDEYLLFTYPGVRMLKQRFSDVCGLSEKLIHSLIATKHNVSVACTFMEPIVEHPIVSTDWIQNVHGAAGESSSRELQPKELLKQLKTVHCVTLRAKYDNKNKIKPFIDECFDGFEGTRFNYYMRVHLDDYSSINRQITIYLIKKMSLDITHGYREKIIELGINALDYCDDDENWVDFDEELQQRRLNAPSKIADIYNDLKKQHYAKFWKKIKALDKKERLNKTI